MIYIILRYFSSAPSLLSVYHERLLNFSNILSTSVEVTCEVFSLHALNVIFIC